MIYTSCSTYTHRRPCAPVLFVRLLLLTAGLALALPSFAGVDRWTALGPEGGEVSALLAHPRDAGVVYAGLEGGGVFVSRDGGESWERLGRSLLVARINALAMARLGDTTLYAATDRGVFRLAEGSDLWEDASGSLLAGASIQALGVDPRSSQNLYVTAAANSNPTTVYRSQDGGQTWSDIGGVPSLYGSLAVAGTTPPTLYAGADRGVFRYREGAGWQRFSAGLPEFHLVAGLLVDPDQPNTVYSGVFGLAGDATGVFRSTNAGVSWQRVGGELSPDFSFPATLALLPGSPGTLLAGEPDGLYRTTLGSGVWEPVNAAPADRSIRALAIGQDGSSIFAGGSRFGTGGGVGVLRSRDGGDSWQAFSQGLPGTFVTSISPDPAVAGRLLLSSESRGLFASSDGGASWEPSGDGIDEARTGPLTRVPGEPGTLYVLAAESAFSESRIYRSTNSGSTWQRIGLDLPDDFLGPVVVDSADSSTLYTTRQGGVLRSTDGGAQWQEVGGRICGQNPFLVAHPEDGGRLLAGCVEDSGAPVSPPIYLSFLLSSEDGGESWQEIFQGPSGGAFVDWNLSYDPNDSATVLAALGTSLASWAQAFRSDDGGGTWEPISGLAGIGVTALLADPQRPGVLLAGTTTEGVLRSLDDGETWHPFNRDLGSPVVNTLAFDPIQPERVWAGTRGGGLYVLDRSPQGACSPSALSLCLAGRFRVEVDWEDFRSRTGQGRSLPLTETTGAFWFFREGNLELAVKVLDGRASNGYFWVFYGGLSTVPYTLTVTDVVTGQQRRYENPAGHLASAGDTRAFLLPETTNEGLVDKPHLAAAQTSSGLEGTSATAALELMNGHFRVEVQWQSPRQGPSAATGVPFTEESGAFFFAREDNLELFVKILEGRPNDGRYPLFFGALTNLGFELKVTNTETGESRTYSNPPGRFGSRVDVLDF